jgi:hypothetical protein
MWSSQEVKEFMGRDVIVWGAKEFILKLILYRIFLTLTLLDQFLGTFIAFLPWLYLPLIRLSFFTIDTHPPIIFPSPSISRFSPPTSNSSYIPAFPIWSSPQQILPTGLRSEMFDHVSLVHSGHVFPPLQPSPLINLLPDITYWFCGWFRFPNPSVHFWSVHTPENILLQPFLTKFALFSRTTMITKIYIFWDITTCVPLCLATFRRNI